MDILEEILSSFGHCSEDGLWAVTRSPSISPFGSVLCTRFLTRPSPRAYWQAEHQSSSCYELISMLSLGNHTSFCLLGAPSRVGDLTNNSNTKRPKQVLNETLVMSLGRKGDWFCLEESREGSWGRQILRKIYYINGFWAADIPSS